jgi:predicted nucleic acid-binding protein
VKWLLDTNVLSETIRPRPDRVVISWVERQPLEDFGISIVTMAELQEGLESAAEERKGHLMRWLNNTVVPSFGERTLPLSEAVLIEWIRISRALAAERMTRKAADLLIAATARVHGMIVVTRDVRDFMPTGVVVYNPWTGSTHNTDSQ